MERTVIAVVGLGYVGLPLALAFGRTAIPTYGFDISQSRIEDLKKGIDISGELSESEVKSSNVIYTANEADLDQANFFIVAVPTPVTKELKPDLTLVESASRLVAKHMKPGSTVVFESTVYPGVTEEVCLPILEEVSGLKFGTDFALGYSPERVNPGDKEHTLATVVKIVAGHDAETTDRIADVYDQVCGAGVYRAKNIKTAEAAKIVENIQRDINIALMNELSSIFEPMGIVTRDVIEAAGTKWNFAKYYPGLVGGHCIGVDPYYLIAKAEDMDYQPQFLKSARALNDDMANRVAESVMKLVEKEKAKILVAGLSFKENVRDIRNSKIEDTIRKLTEAGHTVVGYDPLLTADEIKETFNISTDTELNETYDAVILSAPHQAIVTNNEPFIEVAKRSTVVFDIKRSLPQLAELKRVIYRSL